MILGMKICDKMRTSLQLDVLNERTILWLWFGLPMTTVKLASGYLVPYTISMNFLSVSFCIALNNI